MDLGAAVFAPEGPTLTGWERGFFAEAAPWGFILFARNIETPDQVRALTAELRAVAGRDAPILIDQEGGRVQRMGPPRWRQYLPPLDQMARARDPLRAMWVRSRLIADELHAAGIDVNCAPVGDVATPDTHPFLRNRCYGTEADVVAEAARAVADGLIAGGVLPVMKHMPGHGRARTDSHLEPPRVGADPGELGQMDFAVFAALSDLPIGMTGHMIFDRIDPGRPTTHSATVIRIIREQIGFGGLLISDDLGMEALAGGFAARARGARAAGCDLVLHSSGRRGEMEEVAQGAGRMTPEGAARGAAALALRQAPADVDIPALEAELEALLQEG